MILLLVQLFSNEESTNIIPVPWRLASSRPVSWNRSSSYRTIGFFDTEKIRAALGRRVFTTGGETDSVDYTHRTTAEYLAGEWLARQVRAGLPVGRVRALVGVDGHPAIELRGLHAWLSVFLPEHASLLIDADPYGVLTYGDAASLTPSSRKYLLEALSRLSQSDPWFRSGNWSSSRLGGLSSPEMIDAFRDILSSPNSNFALRSIVIDALAAGRPMPALKDDLVALLSRSDAPYAERAGSLAALLEIGEVGREAIIQTYRNHLGLDGSAIHLRAEILASLYGVPFGPSDVAALLTSALRCTGELAIGTLWSLHERIPLEDIPEILDAFELTERQVPPTHSEEEDRHEVIYLLDRLLLRLLRGSIEISSTKLWRWLRIRRAVRDSYVTGQSEEIGQQLKQKPELLYGMVDVAIAALVVDEHRWEFTEDLRDVTLQALDSDDLLERVLASITTTDEGSDKEAFLYELALTLSYSGSQRAIAAFETLYALGAQRGNLTAIRDRVTVAPITAWRTERMQRKVQAEARQKEIAAQNVRDFAENEAAIRSGVHQGWLGFLAKVYFGRFGDSDKAATPEKRLATAFGPEKVLFAIEGLIAVSQRSDIPSLDSISQMAVEHRHYPWWLAIIAGLDEKWKLNSSIDEWSDDLLTAALAIELVNPTFEQDDNTTRPRSHGWKEAAFHARAPIVRNAYCALAEAGMRRAEGHVQGLHELLNHEALAPFRRETALYFLRTYPNAPEYRLHELLESASRTVEARAELISLARDVLGDSAPLTEANRDRWLITTYLLSPQEFQAEVAARADTSPGIVWLLRDMAGYGRNDRGHLLTLSIVQLEFIAGIAAHHFPNTSRPSGVTGGDTNSWDASEFVGDVIDQLSADSTREATAALSHMNTDVRFSTYTSRIKHALANQLVRRREAEFQPPNWRQTMTTLSNDAPSDVGDLHALLIARLKDIASRIATTNTDIYKRFWNEDRYGRIQTPKSEDSCRDVLIDLLRVGLEPLRVTVEPEGHMAADKRADISVSFPGQKLPIELKRDYHAEV